LLILLRLVYVNRIVPLIDPSCVLLDVEATSKKRLLEQASLLFENVHGLERSKIFDSLFSRERLGSTGLGAEVAVPHGRIKGLKRPLMAVLRSAEGVAFDAPDGKPVRLLFVLLVPEAATEEHLELLSAIAELLSDRALRNTLMTVPSASELLGILNAWEPYQPAS
jgi:nitrogen PTS system EIIA component